MKSFKLFLASVLITAGSLVVFGTSNDVNAQSYTPASCRSTVAGPNSTYTGETSWDVVTNINRNSASTSSLTYRYVAKDSNNRTVYNNTSSSQNRRIVFPGHGQYTVTATVIDGTHRSSCPSITVTIGQPAVCTALNAYPNSARTGETSYDVLMTVNKNDARTSELKYRYTAIDSSDKLLYDKTLTEQNRRIVFPGPGRYEVVATAITGSTRSVCPTTVVTIASAQTSTGTNTTTNNSNTTNNDTNSTTGTNNTTAPATPASANNEDSETVTNDTTSENEEASADSTTTTTQTETNETVAQATPSNSDSKVTTLPNTGMNPIALFGATSVVGYAVDLIRRRLA